MFETNQPSKPLPKAALILGLAVIALFVFLRTGLKSVEHTGWTDDKDHALAEARQDSKLVLMEFTGSDWCEGCIHLEKEVFSTPEFRDYAARHLILLEVDFPHRKYIAPEIARQNASLLEEYKIEGYPTLVVIDHTGKELARYNYTDGGPKALIAALSTLPQSESR